MHGEQDSSPNFWGSELQDLPFMSLLDGSADHLFLGSDHHQDHAARPQSFLQHQGEQDKNTQVPLKLEQSESKKDGSSNHPFVAERRKRARHMVSQLTEEQVAHLLVEDKALLRTSAAEFGASKRKKGKDIVHGNFSEQLSKSVKDHDRSNGRMSKEEENALRQRAFEEQKILQEDYKDLRYFATPSRKISTLSIVLAKKNEEEIRRYIQKYYHLDPADKKEERFAGSIRYLTKQHKIQSSKVSANGGGQQQAQIGDSPVTFSKKGKQVDSQQIPWYENSFDQSDSRIYYASTPYTAFGGEGEDWQGVAENSGTKRTPSPPPALQWSSPTLNAGTSTLERTTQFPSLQTFDESKYKTDRQRRKFSHRNFELREEEWGELSSKQLYLFSVTSRHLSRCRVGYKNALIDWCLKWRTSGMKPKMVSYSKAEVERPWSLLTRHETTARCA